MSKSNTDISKGHTIYYNIIVDSSKGCSESKAIHTMARMIHGEGAGLHKKYRSQLGRFLISEAVKNQRTLCEEYNFKYPKGAYRYSSVLTVDKLINKNKFHKKAFGANVEIARNELLQFNRNPGSINDVRRFNSFVTIKLAYYNPQKWFQNHIEDYFIAGPHVFMRVSRQHSTKYDKMKQHIKTLL